MRASLSGRAGNGGTTSPCPPVGLEDVADESPSQIGDDHQQAPPNSLRALRSNLGSQWGGFAVIGQPSARARTIASR